MPQSSAQDSVTVIIPSYNRAHLVPRAIRSALANVEPGDEILVVDDGSTDSTRSVVTALGPPVRYLPAPHGGAGAARNFGLRHAAGDLVAFLDSDDEWLPGKLALMRRFLEARPDVLFCFSDFVGVTPLAVEHRYLRTWHGDARGWDEILGPGVLYSQTAPLPDGWSDFLVHTGSIYLGELLSDYVATSTCVTRRVEAGDALRFAEDFKIAEDKECFARLAGAGAAAYFDCETSCQHGHSGPRVSDLHSTVLQAQARLTIMERVWRQDPMFMSAHAREYFARKDEQHLFRARYFIGAGQLTEARKELAATRSCPLSYRLATSMPAPVVATLLRVRRWLRRTLPPRTPNTPANGL